MYILLSFWRRGTNLAYCTQTVLFVQILETCSTPMLILVIKNSHALKVEFQVVDFGLLSAYPSLIFWGWNVASEIPQNT